MASAFAYMHRAEAEAVAIVCRTDTRTDKCAIPADGQMLQTIGRFLELDPGWYLFRTEREHLRIRPPLRTVKGLRSGGQMRADDPPLLRGPGALAAATGGQRSADILPRVGALVYVVLDVDADGISLLDRPRAGRSSWRICRRVVRSQEGAGRLLGYVRLIGPVQAGLGRAITGRGPDQRAEDGLGYQVMQTGQVHRRQGGSAGRTESSDRLSKARSAWPAVGAWPDRADGAARRSAGMGGKLVLAPGRLIARRCC